MAKTITRNKIKSECEKNFSYFVLDDLLKETKEFIELYKLEEESITYEFDSYEYYGSIEKVLYFRGWRWETDEEFEIRKTKLEAERIKEATRLRKSKAAEKIRAEEKDRLEYERLKEKYENGAK